ncbi:MAG: hypothetical protein AAGF99_17065 [Bacteroidota bacterium]
MARTTLGTWATEPGFSTEVEVEFNVHYEDVDETILRFQVWTADYEGVKWTAQTLVSADDFFLKAAPLGSPAVHVDALSKDDLRALDDTPIVTGAISYLEHSWPGRVVIGHRQPEEEPIWAALTGEGTGWNLPKRCGARIDIAVPVDPIWRRWSNALLVRVRLSDTSFVYPLDALTILAWRTRDFLADDYYDRYMTPPSIKWTRTQEKGKPRDAVRFDES